MSEKYFVGNPLTGEMLVSIQGYPESSPYKYEFRSKPFRDEVALFNSQEEASEEFNKFSKPDDSILVTSIAPFNF